MTECIHQQLPHHLRSRSPSTPESSAIIQHLAFQDIDSVRRYESGLPTDLGQFEELRATLEQGVVFARFLTRRLSRNKYLEPADTMALWDVNLDILAMPTFDAAGLNTASASSHPEPHKVPILDGHDRLLYAERHEGLLRLKPSRALAKAVGDFRMTIYNNDLNRIYPIISGVHIQFITRADADSLKSVIVRAAGCTWVTNADTSEGLGVHN
ncbi:hypothetical protein MN608_09473 [Microdochium nivale]|nr:hypothetical protein MN608_09473 [Microdochium nivale]